MSELPEPPLERPTPVLGRAVAVAMAALFLMVGLGVYWVWQRAQREEQWRRQVNAAEPIVPRTTP